ncbi:MAG: archaemetzincin [Pyrinomonadaceae bacterium]
MSPRSPSTKFHPNRIAAILALLLASCAQSDNAPASNMTAAREAKKEIQELRAAMKKIEPFFEPMGKPEAYDWLGSHTEPGETFEEYLDSDPTKPTKERQKIYVLPLGTFTPEQKKTIKVATGYLDAFYDLGVEQMPQRELPKPAREQGRNIQRSNTALANARALANDRNSRRAPVTGHLQIRTGYIMDAILKPMLPADAAAFIAFTNEDLFPDDSMSFVFGQASLENRVGVWSLARLEFKANRPTFLHRTLKIAAHETGHMFSMRHCTKYECVMSGTNHIGETDRRPIDACPECTAKICWLSDIEIATRYKRLAEFCRRNGLLKEAMEFERKTKAVS